jgi:predicted nucleotidyltransferase
MNVVTLNDIREFSQALVSEFHPRRVLLFGSHASGTARDDSDVDLLVTMDYEGNSLRTAGQMLRKLQPKFAVDLIIRTETELRERLRQNDGFLKEATANGRTLYEATN